MIRAYADTKILIGNNITFVKGNIFNTKAQTVVNTVNCVGVMGKGIALVYKLRYPKMFDIVNHKRKRGLQ